MSFRVISQAQEIISYFINREGSLNVPRFATNPPVEYTGCLYFNTSNNILYISQGVNNWIPIGSNAILGPALTSIANLITSGNEMIYTIASNTYQTTPISSAGRSFLSYQTAAAQRSGLGLAIGVDVQQQSNILDSLEALTVSNDILPYSSAGIYSGTLLTPWARTNLLDITSVNELITLLNTVTIGTLTTQNALVKVNGSPKQITQSGILVDSSNNMTGIGNITLTGNLDSITPFIRTQLANIGINSINNTQWNYLTNLNQQLATTNSPSFNGLTLGSSLNMNSNKIINLLTPTQANDAANKSYVDSVAGAGISPIESVSVASTISLSVNYDANNGTLTANPATTTLNIDSISITANDGKRILIKDQSSNIQNGIYKRTSDVGGAWVLTRTSDFNTPTIPKGTYTLVLGGTTNINTSWILTQAVTQFVIPGSPVIWSQFSASQNIITGNGLTSSGNIWSVNPTTQLKFTGIQLDLNTVQPTYGGTGLILGIGDTNKVLITNGTNPMLITKTSPSGDFVGTTDNQVLTTKTLTDNSNNVIARSLWADNGSSSVSVYSSSPPVVGQVLTALNATTASWQSIATPTNPTNTLFVYKSAPDISPTYSTLAGALNDALATGASSTTPCQIIMYSGTFQENNPLNIPPWVTITGVSANQTNVIVKAQNSGQNIFNMKGNVRINGLVIDGYTGTGNATIGIYSYLGVGGGSPISPAQDVINNTTVKNCSDRALQVIGNGSQYSKLMACDNVSVIVTALTTMNYGITCSAGAIFKGSLINISGFFGGLLAYLDTGLYCYDRYSYCDVSNLLITNVGTCIYCGGSSSNTQSEYPTIKCSGLFCELYKNYGIYMGPKSVGRFSDALVSTDATGLPLFTSQIALYFENPALPAMSNLFISLWTDIRLDKTVFNGGASNNLPDIRGSNLSEIPNFTANNFLGRVSVGSVLIPSEFTAGSGGGYINSMVVFVYNSISNTSTNYTNSAAYTDYAGFNAFPSPIAINQAFYIGDTYRFSGIRLGLLTAIILSSGTITSSIAWEYWNGVSWVSLPFMISLANQPYTNYGIQSFGVNTTLTAQTDYQYRFGDIASSWSSSLAAGAGIVLPAGMPDSLRYYIRARVLSTNITTIPVVDSVRLQTNNSKIDTTGFMEYFGLAMPKQRINIPNSTLLSTGVPGETAPPTIRLVATTWATSTISANVPSCYFKHNATTTVAFIYSLPSNICSAFNANLVINYSRAANGGHDGDIYWQLDYIYTNLDSEIGDPTGAPSTTGVSTGIVPTVAPINARTQGKSVIPFSVLGLDTSSVVWFKLTRFGSLDTFSGDVNIFNLYIEYVAWSVGTYNS